MNVIFDKPWETMGGFCQDPVTVTMLTIASTGLQAISAIKEGQAASAEAKYTSQVADRNAQISQQQTEQALETQDRERRLRRGAAMASAGASGVGIESFGDILSSSAAQEEMDLLNIKNEGLLQQQNFQSESAFAKAKGKQAKSNSYLKAGAAILGGASSLYSGGTSSNFYNNKTGSMGASSSRLRNGTTVNWN